MGFQGVRVTLILFLYTCKMAWRTFGCLFFDLIFLRNHTKVPLFLDTQLWSVTETPHSELVTTMKVGGGDLDHLSNSGGKSI